MIKERYQSELDQMRSQRRIYERVCVALLAANLILGLQILGNEDEDRIVVVPPTVDKKFWVEGDELSAEYLELMAEWLAGLSLSTTPDSVDIRSALFLRHVEPSAHAGIKSQFDLRAEQIRKDNISTLFFPTFFQTAPAIKQVAVTGDFISVVSGVPAPAVRRTWRLSFTSGGQDFWVTEFVEVNHDQPFDERDYDIDVSTHTK